MKNTLYELSGSCRVFNSVGWSIDAGGNELECVKRSMYEADVWI